MPKTQSSGSCLGEVRIVSEVTKQESSTPFMRSCANVIMSLLISKINEQSLSVKLIKELKEKVKSLEESQIEFIYKKIMKDISDSIKPEPSSPMKTDEQGVDPSKVKPEPSSPMKIKEKAVQVTQGLPSAVKQEQDSSGSTKLIELIRPSYLQILEWFEQHIYFFDVLDLGGVLSKGNFLHLTKDVMIDKKETAKSLIDGGFLGAKQMYELACLYCLEGYVEESWERLKEEEKDGYRNDEEILPIIKFWTSERKDDRRVEKDYGYLLQSAVEDGNEVAVKYLLSCLSKLEQKSEVDLVALAITAASISSSEHPYTYYTPVLCALLDEIKDGEKNKFSTQHHRFSLLNHLVGLEKYEEIFNVIWESGVSERTCQALLANIASKIVGGNSNYQATFEEFWEKIGKMENKNNRVGERLLPHLFQFSKEYFERVLNLATTDEKRKITGYAISYKGWVPKNCNLDLLQIVVEKCLDDEAERKKFMENVIFSGSGFEVYTDLVISGKLVEFENLREKFLDKEVNFNDFKDRFFRNRGADIFASLCMKDDSSLFNKFLEWRFSDSGRIKRFKQKLILARRNVEAIINAALDKKNYGWEQYRKEFIKWGDFEENKFKGCFKGEKSGSVKELYTGLLFEQGVGLVDEFLSWCFDGEKDKIDGFKKAFVSGDKAVDFCIDKIKAGKLRTVENFLKWVEMSKEEYKNLQQKCSNKLEDKQKSILEEAFEKVVVVGLLRKRRRESDGSTQKPKSSIQKIEVEGVQSAEEENLYK